MNKEKDFGQGSVSANILRLAIPMTLAQLINVLYNVVDRIYIGHIPHTSTQALTGIGLTLPVITIITAFANLFGMGGAPLFSMARGADEPERAERIMGNSFAMLLASGALLAVFCYLFKHPLLYLFGASDVTYPYANAYISIYLLGTLFVMVSLGMNNFINAQGFGVTGMLTVSIGALLNLVLDPLFIFVFHMGVRHYPIPMCLLHLGTSFSYRRKSNYKINKKTITFKFLAYKGNLRPGLIWICHVNYQQFCPDHVQCYPAEIRRRPVCRNHDGNQFRSGDYNHASHGNYQRGTAHYEFQLWGEKIWKGEVCHFLYCYILYCIYSGNVGIPILFPARLHPDVQ